MSGQDLRSIVVMSDVADCNDSISHNGRTMRLTGSNLVETAAEDTDRARPTKSH